MYKHSKSYSCSSGNDGIPDIGHKCFMIDGRTRKYLTMTFLKRNQQKVTLKVKCIQIISMVKAKLSLIRVKDLKFQVFR